MSDSKVNKVPYQTVYNMYYMKTERFPQSNILNHKSRAMCNINKIMQLDHENKVNLVV